MRLINGPDTISGSLTAKETIIVAAHSDLLVDAVGTTSGRYDISHRGSASEADDEKPAGTDQSPRAGDVRAYVRSCDNACHVMEQSTDEINVQLSSESNNGNFLDVPLSYLLNPPGGYIVAHMGSAKL